MFVLIPIRTESVIRRTPMVNYLLVGANVLAFLLLNDALSQGALAELRSRYLALHPDHPAVYQFFTYQFLHADLWHLLGNLLFLWVFGNSVNSKMGNGPYLMFYLAGGVFAGWGFSVLNPGPSPLVGASGAIAAVTTAYLALFPRSHVTVLAWIFVFIHLFEVPAMLLICVKVIVWDNVIAPSIGGQDSIAYSAHLAGYLFGFSGAMGMLFVRALPRDQFDMLALWKRWHQRRELATAMAEPEAAARAQYGRVARVEAVDPEQRALEQRRLDEVADLRSRITERVEQRDGVGATELYEQLMAMDPKQCLAERHQLDLARAFYGSGRFPQAAAAFDRYLDCYAGSAEATNVRLLLGIIYARDLRQYELADKHLTQCLESISDDTRRKQCYHWLTTVRAALGKRVPESL
ncbi:MAG: rhomboid family intramembrane serine protease [Phycisphaerae bacterium]|jgi:membrane associated rhomboid family serine protease